MTPFDEMLLLPIVIACVVIICIPIVIRSRKTDKKTFEMMGEVQETEV